MKIRLFRLGLLWALVLSLGACSSSMYHKALMKGQVVKVNGGEVMMCIGSREGAKVKDEFRVMRSTFRTDVVEDGESDYELVEVGRVEILEVVDEHYAIAKVLGGNVQKYDVAQRAK